jgi:hypothetical protein
MAKAIKEEYEEMGLEELVGLRDRLNAIIADKAEAQKNALREQLAALDALTGRPKPVKVEEGVRQRAAPKALYRSPEGVEYSGRGALPRWAKDLGITSKEGLEPYKI